MAIIITSAVLNLTCIYAGWSMHKATVRDTLEQMEDLIDYLLSEKDE